MKVIIDVERELGRVIREEIKRQLEERGLLFFIRSRIKSQTEKEFEKKVIKAYKKRQLYMKTYNENKKRGKK